MQLYGEYGNASHVTYQDLIQIGIRIVALANLLNTVG